MFLSIIENRAPCGAIFIVFLFDFLSPEFTLPPLESRKQY